MRSEPGILTERIGGWSRCRWAAFCLDHSANAVSFNDSWSSLDYWALASASAGGGFLLLVGATVAAV